MKYYPVCLDVKNKKCLVIGGGDVGTRKALMLIKCNADVIVISPKASEKLKVLSEKKVITLIKRQYKSDDISDAFLVIGATNNEKLNRRIFQDAQRLNKLCNIVDCPQLCNFILPSVVNRGDLILTVSTSGKSPAYAKKVRQTLENLFGEEHEIFLKLMGAIRKKLLMEAHEPDSYKPVFEKLISSGFIELIKQDDVLKINKKLVEILGKGYDFETLVKETEGE